MGARQSFPFISFLALVVVTISFAIPWLLVAASGIYAASLYRYATRGDPASNFRAETMSSAFRSKAGGVPRFGQPR